MQRVIAHDNRSGRISQLACDIMNRVHFYPIDIYEDFSSMFYKANNIYSQVARSDNELLIENSILIVRVTSLNIPQREQQ